MAIDATAATQNVTKNLSANATPTNVSIEAQALATVLGIGNLVAAGSESVAKLIDRLVSGASTV